MAGAPDLVVEVLSPSTRRVDEGAKRRLFERHEVPEYWILDPQRETVRVLRAGAGPFSQPAELSAAAGDVLATPLLPGLEIPLPEIFE
ncbi:MAG TPA: Uma2 family endonuclease [Thermoanaerobaculia bacterium]|nr:Uma2 family endonuclease [Thermoanaerobaculia bacterium]